MEQTIEEHYRLAETLRVAQDILAERRAGIEAIKALQQRVDALERPVDEEAHASREGLLREIKAVQGRTEGFTVAILALARKLEEAESKLEEALRETRDKVHVVRQAQSQPLDYRTLLAYAKRISPYTSGPPTANGGYPQAFSRPPIPVDADIRRSILMQMQISGGQLPSAQQGEVAAAPVEKTDEFVAPLPPTHHHAEPVESVLDLDL